MEKCRAVKNLVFKHKPAVFFLQETKLKLVDDRVLRSLGGTVLTKAMSVVSDGAAGGLITLWNEESFVVKACISNQRCIILAGELVKIKKEIVFCNIYASSKDSKKSELLDFIITAQKSFSMPWCIGGDFNVVLNSSERIGVSNNKAAMRSFNTFVCEAKLIDLPLLGMAYTWTNQREEAAWARLDRFVISMEFLSWFPKLQQVGLSRSLSDHNPITLCVRGEDWGPRPF